MARTFAYVRVSTVGQTAENQVQEITSAGFAIEPHRIIAETVSGSVAAFARKGFTRLLDRLEKGDVLVVTKLDRLGRDAIDVGSTVRQLDDMGVRVHCLALGGIDLTSSAGRMTMGVINAVAQFERDLLIERTQAGLARARGEGRRLGRPPSVDDRKRAEILEALDQGESINSLASRFGTSRQTVMRIREVHRRQPTGMEGADRERSTA
ncbi:MULTISPECIES: recombinase family protein [Sphingomonas]|uniref:Recombinase family protein n=1 Tax=Sphingomonas paucimobilis TaxID=13689 RepID=A0A7Y2KL71_SPHPI|nr:recombinase family protein [Sphingomonas paucimobilis]NNG56022.1 recombinase family protein [Sphingomonas paucimobilis]